MKKIPIHFPLFISGSIFILVTGVVVGLYILHPDNYFTPFVQSFEQRIGIQKLASTSSTVDISTSGGQLRLLFNIADKDKSVVEMYSENLGVSNAWEKGVEVGLDDKTLVSLQPFLPLRANLSFEGKKVLISSRSFSFLKSALPETGSEFATGSGRISFIGEGNKYHLQVSQPKDLLIYATSSGALSLSKKVSSLFSIGDKVATIELNLNGKSLDGEIVLK